MFPFWTIPQQNLRRPRFIAPQNNIASGIGGNGNDIITINAGESSGIPGPVGSQGPQGPTGNTGNVGPAGNVNFVTVTDVVRDYTPTANDYYLCVDTIANPVNITLPAGLLGRVYVIKDCDGNSLINPIRINGTGGETIDGSDAIINSDYASLSFIFNGTEWNTF
jgi:hypothetical protein